MTELASHLGVFLREHLPRDRNASRHTVQSYADSFQLLVCFAAERLGVRPCRIEVEQLTAPLILDFLDSLERERNNTIGTRNVRLAAFKSFFRFLEFRVPACLDRVEDDQLVELFRNPSHRSGAAFGVRLREVLRPYFAAALSIRAIARSLETSPSTVGEYLRPRQGGRAHLAGTRDDRRRRPSPSLPTTKLNQFRISGLRRQKCPSGTTNAYEPGKLVGQTSVLRTPPGCGSTPSAS